MQNEFNPASSDFLGFLALEKHKNDVGKWIAEYIYENLDGERRYGGNTTEVPTVDDVLCFFREAGVDTGRERCKNCQGPIRETAQGDVVCTTKGCFSYG